MRLVFCIFFQQTTDKNMSDEQAAIIDCGSLFTRVGLSGDEEPSAVFRTMVHNQTQVGDEVPETYDDVNISFPVQGGTIVNWDQIELVWKYCFSKFVKNIY